eukprot:scaffold121560_cov46-Prasinocladus_malaysianus.AAC.1
MEGLRVCVGKGYGVDVGGILWLDGRDDASNWAPWIKANESAARARAKSAAQLQAQEASVLALSPEYLKFLRAAIAAAAMHGPIGGEQRPYSSVPLCVLAANSGDQLQQPYGL